ncbi:MAG: DUF3108 domain-containing protein [Methylobacillus sp.]|jgi:hypothetical protein|nr:DUF3108 domain-containing protein [Methylobacillus sp.]
MIRWLLPALLIIVQTAYAAPKEIKAVYQYARNGQVVATVTETFTQSGGKYKVESVTEGIDAYKLLGKLRRTSEGEVTKDGLRPVRFEQQADLGKSVSADFDWASGQLTMKYKNKTVTAELELGTQDLASFAYQFMFKPPRGKDVFMPVTTGRKLKLYHYKITEQNTAVQTKAGKYNATHLVDAEAGDEQREIWLSAEARYIPVRIVAVDDDGVKNEQTLTSLHVVE